MVTLCILKAEDDQSCIADPESIDVSKFSCPKCISCNPDMSMYVSGVFMPLCSVNVS